LHEPKSGLTIDQINPTTGEELDCGADDIDAAVNAAKTACKEWRRLPPLERPKMAFTIPRNNMNIREDNT
jgi:acyl-CoA reductase-like NAD-dependent aldehyde dehydrogenase